MKRLAVFSNINIVFFGFSKKFHKSTYKNQVINLFDIIIYI
jgi:hypothetical protein